MLKILKTATAAMISLAMVFALTPAALAEGTQSSRAQLQSLAFDSGDLSPAFDASHLNYKLLVPAGTDTTTLTVAPADSGAKVTINGKTATTLAIKVSAKAKTVQVRVSESGYKSTTYKVIVKQAPSTDATLKSIAAGTFDLSPAFSASTTEYTVALPSDKSGVTIQVAKNEKNQIVRINGAKALKKHFVLKSGASKTVKITVTAQDKKTKQTYTVTISRP